MHKTLIGLNNFLFLTNDVSYEIENHIKNESSLNIAYVNNYKNKKNHLLVIFPDKSVCCSKYLPDNIIIQRKTVEHLLNELNNVYDGYECLKDMDDIFYKTDTHMNLKGCYEIYKFFIKTFNKHFNQNIKNINANIKCDNVVNLFFLNLGIGDLTWDINLGSQTLIEKTDNYYYSDEIDLFYLRHKINYKSIKFYDYDFNENNNLNGVLVDWNILSNHIIITTNNNDNNFCVLIFYDSFLISSMTLYMKTFYKCIFIKNVYDEKFVKKYDCDYVIEFRVERFLNNV
jgi:hypothetical protein